MDSVINPAHENWYEKPDREAKGTRYRRYLVKTHLIQPGEALEETLIPYLDGRVQPGDIIVLSEKIVAISENRVVPLKDIRPRSLARFLSRHVRELGYGLGLRRPETMEMAIREAGTWRILLAAGAGAWDRITGRSGDFYRVAGREIAAIDGPGPTTIAPYNECVVLSPAHPEIIIEVLEKNFGVGVAVVDVNDVGSEVLDASSELDVELIKELLRDNPMGQGAQRTPVGILRPVTEKEMNPSWPKTETLSDYGGTVIGTPGSGDGGLVLAHDEVASTAQSRPRPIVKTNGVTSRR